MVKAHHHPQQARRLAALRSYDILDTPREADFDDIAALAAALCGTPIGVVNLIDADRQWFKAEVGLGTRETPLETSICSHIILAEDFSMIEDTHKDPRTSDNELCMPVDGLRFYAGALLVADHGLPIGTLCVLDNKPNRLDAEQKQALKVLARRVMRELDLRRSLRAQNILRDEIDHRVKNSLATVGASINLYKRQAEKSGDIDGAFDAVRRHIDSVSAVHNALQRSDTGGTLDLAEYFADLADKLRQSLPQSVKIKVEVPADMVVAHNLAMTLGLVANEFVANTIKHGMADKNEAEINFDLKTVDDMLVLSCRNDLPQNEDRENPGSGIGSRLIEASISQYGGDVKTDGSPNHFRLVARLPFASDTD